MHTARRFALAGSLILAFPALAVAGAAGQSDKKPAVTEASRTEGASPSAAKKETFRPGKDRWPVKTASDLDSGEICLKPVRTTVEYLLAIPRPVDMPLDQSNPGLQEHRANPAETTIWTVEADVIACQQMPDGDYRLTIRGASGKTMVLEMPDPDPRFVDPKSPFASRIKAARTQFDSRQQPDRTAKEMKGHAVISGIGFFARAYGKQKDAVNGNLIQLHPVLNIEWLEAPTKEFTASADPEKQPVKMPPVKPTGTNSARKSPQPVKRNPPRKAGSSPRLGPTDRSKAP